MGLPASELQLRALRVVDTQVANLLGEVTTVETMSLLALEFSEVDETLRLVGALAEVGAVSIIMLAHDRGVEPHVVLTELRSLMAPRT